ncbi:MAG: hypothetical protein HN337_09150 [Deltaproteobacteria bacterium]|jgi:uncharacterized RDD family membrane protein YckC|nr:hypothetical protein [Deltaproteobacteria bacterium]
MPSNEFKVDQTDLIDVGDIEAAMQDEVTETPDDYENDSNDILGYEDQSGPEGPAIAEIRDRFSAFAIDALMLYIIYWPAMLIYRSVAFGSAAGPIPFIGRHGLIFNGVFLLIALLWFVLPELALNASFGKLLCNLTIRRMDGSPVSFTSILIRNILRPLDIILLPTLLITGMMEWSGWHRRLGDVLGGTVVLRKLGSRPKQYVLSLELISSATKRAVAFLIDLTFFAAFIGGYALLLNPEEPLGSMIVVLMTPVVCIFFFAFPEWVFKTSPGKWIVGLTICNEEGAAITLVGSMIRTIWRIFDTNPFGFMTILFSVRRQRPGDTAAGTVVIKIKREARGFIGLIVWFFLSIGMLYTGLNNPDNFLSSDFQINFLPSIDLNSSRKQSAVPMQKILAIRNFSFAEGDAKTPRKPSIFEPGETVFMLFDVNGYTVTKDDVWVQEDLIISYPDGSVGLKLENINDFHQELEEGGSIGFENNIALPANAQAGRYTVTINIRDRLANKDIKEQRFFYVTPSSSKKERNTDKNAKITEVIPDNKPIPPKKAADTPQKDLKPGRSFDTN